MRGMRQARERRKKPRANAEGLECPERPRAVEEWSPRVWYAEQLSKACRSHRTYKTPVHKLAVISIDLANRGYSLAGQRCRHETLLVPGKLSLALTM